KPRIPLWLRALRQRLPQTHTPPSEIHTLSLHDALPIYDAFSERRFALLRSGDGRAPFLGGHFANRACEEPHVTLGVLCRIASFSDRKSTRLNSSHLGISYAVFCLKKKKNTFYIVLCFNT